MPNFDSPRIVLLAEPTPVHEMSGLRDALGGGPRLLVKRDDVIPFGFGGNKVRKLEYVLAEALDAGADTLVTLGGIQSNHARATAAAAATLGLRCVLILNGTAQERPTAKRCSIVCSARRSSTSLRATSVARRASASWIDCVPRARNRF